MEKRPVRRIVLVLEALNMSGPAFASLNVVPEFLSKGCRVMVVAREGGEREEMFRAAGADVRVFPRLGVPVLGRSAVDSVKKFEPDVIHAQSASVAVAAGKLADAAGCSLAVTVNRLDGEGLENIASRKGTGFIALSDAIRERLANDQRIPRDKITIIPNGLNLKHFTQADRKAPPEEEGRLPVVGTYGTLDQMKGQREFLQAASEVIKTGHDAEFLVMGHGPDKQNLRELAENIGVARRLTFSSSTITDSRNIGNIDIFVEPTRREGFGMSVLQAMATGVPVVACGVGGIFGLVEDGVTGLLVPAGNISEMAAAITRLLDEPSLRSELAHNAREKVEKEFNSREVSRKLLNYFEGLG